MLSVLQDGRSHSRLDIFDRVGFMLTNNAASELRARGIDVQHRVKDGLHTYRLSLTRPEPAEVSERSLSGLLAPGSGSVSELRPNPRVQGTAQAGAPTRDGKQLALSVAPPWSPYD